VKGKETKALVERGKASIRRSAGRSLLEIPLTIDTPGEEAHENPRERGGTWDA